MQVSTASIIMRTAPDMLAMTLHWPQVKCHLGSVLSTMQHSQPLLCSALYGERNMLDTKPIIDDHNPGQEHFH